MSDNGYVYVLMNPSMDNLVKIGKTERSPEERAKELSSTTGVPTPFVVVYESYFESCSKAEEFVHTSLENKALCEIQWVIEFQLTARGVAIFAKACFGHPSPSKRQKLQARHATSRNSGTPVTLIRSPTQRMGYALNALRP